MGRRGSGRSREGTWGATRSRRLVTERTEPDGGNGWEGLFVKLSHLLLYSLDGHPVTLDEVSIVYIESRFT